MKRGFIFKRRVACICESIPRADHLTDVAAKDPIAHFVTQFSRDVLFEFDGEIGDTTACVNGTVWKNTIGWAGFNAACTRAAVIGDERWVRFEFEIEENFGEQKIRSMFGMDETSILANPANACTLRK